MNHRLRRDGKPEFTYSLNNVAANHLLKTVPLLEFIGEGGYDGVFIGIRWDENPARAGEVFFSRREKPLHIRVHPILQFTERDVTHWAISYQSTHYTTRATEASMISSRQSQPAINQPGNKT